MREDPQLSKVSAPGGRGNPSPCTSFSIEAQPSDATFHQGIQADRFSFSAANALHTDGGVFWNVVCQLGITSGIPHTFLFDEPTRRKTSAVLRGRQRTSRILHSLTGAASPGFKLICQLLTAQ